MRLLSGNVLQEVASNQASSRASARFSALLSLASEAGEACFIGVEKLLIGRWTPNSCHAKNETRAVRVQSPHHSEGFHP